MKIFLDIGFTFLHCLLIIFNLFGWCFKKTRKANLICLTLTFFAWFGLGFFYGWGYCPLTEWHWNIKTQLGVTNLPNSFIKFLVDATFFVDSNPSLIDIATFTFFFLALLCSLIANLKKKRA